MCHILACTANRGEFKQHVLQHVLQQSGYSDLNQITFYYGCFVRYIKELDLFSTS